MSVDSNRGYEIDGPLIIGDRSFYLGAVSPHLIPIINAPLESIYIRGDGETFYKTGTGDDAGDWTKKTSTTTDEVKSLLYFHGNW